MLEVTRRTAINGVWQDAGLDCEAESVESAARRLGALPGDVLVLEAPAVTDRRSFFEAYWSDAGKVAIRPQG